MYQVLVRAEDDLTQLAMCDIHEHGRWVRTRLAVVLCSPVDA